MVIKNRKGEIKSYPNWEIIEPNRKYLDSHSICTSSNFWYLLGKLVKTQESE